MGDMHHFRMRHQYSHWVSGYVCATAYRGGHDETGNAEDAAAKNTLGACLQSCDNDPLCSHVAFLQGTACSRYNPTDGCASTTYPALAGYVTYVKEPAWKGPSNRFDFIGSSFYCNFGYIGGWADT
jgi:hypothetical protein